MASICIFSALYLPSMGGVERFTDSLAHELMRQGHSVCVVTNNTHDLPSHEVLPMGVEIFRVPCRSLLNGRYPVMRRTSEYRELMKRLDEREFDGVLVNTRFYPHSLLGASYAKRHGLCPVVLDHGSAYLTLGNAMVDWCIERYEDVITAHLKRKDISFYGISGKSVEWLEHFGIDAKGVIPNSIDASSYRRQASGRGFRAELGISDDRLFLAFTGRLIPEKGIATLIKMMELLKNEPVDLVIAGEGPLRNRVEMAALSHVHLVGRLDQPDIAALLKEADLFCLPTRSEGFSTSLLEAAACGTTSLVTDVGGARELIPDDSYGFVVPNADPRVFADIVRRVLRGEVDMHTMGERCQKRVDDQCSWKAVAECVLRSFER